MRKLSWVCVGILLSTVAATPAQDAKAQAVDGIWRVTLSAEGDVKDIFNGPLDGAVFIFQTGDLVIVTKKSELHKGPCKVTAGKDGMFDIDFKWNGKAAQGLGLLDGGKITLCFDRNGGPRPTALVLDKPALALLRLEKQTGSKNASVVPDDELKWIRSVANDFLLAFVKRDYQTYRKLVTRDVWKGSATYFRFEGQREPDTGEVRLSGNDDYYWGYDHANYKKYLTSFSIDTVDPSPTGEEVVFRGTFGGEKQAHFTMRIIREEKTRRWAVGPFDWDFVREKKDK
jgi:hypothetical protein